LTTPIKKSALICVNPRTSAVKNYQHSIDRKSQAAEAASPNKPSTKSVLNTAPQIPKFPTSLINRESLDYITQKICVNLRQSAHICGQKLPT
jgi:hypothetical protein